MAAGLSFQRVGNPFFLVLLSLCLGVAGCSQLHGKPSMRNEPALSLKKIAVLPMDRASSKPVSERPTCNISGEHGIIASAYVPPEAAQEVNSILLGMVKDDARFVPVSENLCLGFLSSMLEKNPRAGELKLLQGFARDLGVDAVLYGKLYRFRERVGSEYSVKSPASVAFSMILVRATDGAVLWRYSFDETQQALTENILNWKFYRKAGMRWVTAEELARYGMEEAMNELRKLLS